MQQVRFKFSQGVGLWESYQSHCPSENPNDWFQISPGRVGQILLSNSPTKPCKQRMDVEGGDTGIYDIAYRLSLAGTATSIIFCHDKGFVAINMCLSRQSTPFVATKLCLPRQNFCPDKIMFVTIKYFVVTKMILVAAPAHDNR